VVIDFEPVQVVGVSLQLHEEAAVGDVGGQAAGRLLSSQVVALDPEEVEDID